MDHVYSFNDNTTFLSMNISVDYEKNKNSPQKGSLISLIVLTVICTVTGIFTSLSEGSTVMDGVLAAGIFLICGSIPFLFLYNLRKKNGNKNFDE